MIATGINIGSNMLMNPKWDDELADDNLALEDAQDDELVMNTIKNGYYTVSNAILSRPAMIATGINIGSNMLMNPKWDDELADDNLAFVDDVADNNLALEDAQDDELVVNAIKNGYYTVSNAILTRPAMIATGINIGSNMLMNPKWDDELADDNLALEDAQDDELVVNAIKNGYYTVSNAILTRPAMIATGINIGSNMLMNPKWDDELSAVEKAEKTETKKSEKPKEPRRHRQRLERPDDKIKRNTRLRVPKEHVADNTLFDLADLIEDN